MDKQVPLYGSLSWCHQCPSLIVRSREGGFVTQNCIVCGKPQKLTFRELPRLSCEVCNGDLEAFINDYKNYSYKCERCDIAFELPSVVPHWDERFKYHGFGLDSDYVDDFAETIGVGLPINKGELQRIIEEYKKRRHAKMQGKNDDT